MFYNFYYKSVRNKIFQTNFRKYNHRIAQFNVKL